MKTPGLKLGTAISLLVHLALLQGLVLAGVRGEPAPIESEFIMIELAGPEVGAGAAAAPEQVAKLEPAPLPERTAPVVKARPQIQKRQIVKAPALGERPVAAPAAEAGQASAESGSEGFTARGRLGSGPLATSSAIGGGADSGLVRAGYGSQLASWLNRFKQYPALARRRGIEGDAKVRLVIERNGALLSSSLHVASGSALLDESALAMVKAASPFPRVPDELAGERFEFEVPVAFRLR